MGPLLRGPSVGICITKALAELSPELLHRWRNIIYDSVTSVLKLCRKCFAIDYAVCG